MIALISDIHGNYEALKSVLAEIDRMGASEIYCLGDVVGYYTQVNECCDALRERNILSVMGNHDWYMVSGTECERSQSVRDCMRYQRKIIRKDNKNWILGFKTIVITNGISIVHGGWNNPIDEYIDPSENYFVNIQGSIFASGHTHMQCIYEYGEKIYCNPGSVGQPRDGDNRAAFATFDGKKFKVHRVEYDIEKVSRLMELEGFNSYYYGCLRDGAKKLHK